MLVIADLDGRFISSTSCFYQIIPTHNMEIEIPISCPKCSGKMRCISYDGVTLQILRKRSWQVCNTCDYERSTDDFKQLLCCV